MNSYWMVTGVKIGIAVALAVLFGNGSVVMFNRMPIRWFEDIDENGARVLPEELREVGDGSRQRLPSTPWKYIFVAYFAAVGIFLAMNSSLQYEIAVLFVLVILLEMAISDAKYRIIPDPLSILLAVSAVGFIGFQEEWWEPLAGAGIGAGLILAIWGLGRLITHKDVFGGADLKFYAAMGLILGRGGVFMLFILTQILIAAHALYLVIFRRMDHRESLPMLPYAFAAATIYFLFLRDALTLLEI